jgi:hypothetical protein
VGDRLTGTLGRVKHGNNCGNKLLIHHCRALINPPYRRPTKFSEKG